MSVRELAGGASLAALFVLVLWAAAKAEEAGGALPEDDPEEASDPDPIRGAVSGAPLIRPPVFQAPRLPPEPPPGMGRLNLAVGGNRQWCTYRDDRVVQPPPGMGSTSVRRRHAPVYTFGYQFTIAAISRARPAEAILLFESPVVRTTELRQAAKLGRGVKKPPGPTIVVPNDDPKRPTYAPEQPTSLVPYWQEQLACTTLPEAFDFDLEPGTYDVYMAFDILARSGTWTHRSIGFLTDVLVSEGRRTRLEGRVDLVGGTRREVDLLSSALLPATGEGAGAAP